MHHGRTEFQQTHQGGDIVVISHRAGELSPDQEASVGMQIYCLPLFATLKLTPAQARNLAERLAEAALFAESDDPQVIDFQLHREPEAA